MELNKKVLFFDPYPNTIKSSPKIVKETIDMIAGQEMRIKDALDLLQNAWNDRHIEAATK